MSKNGLPKYCGWNVDRADGKRRVRFRRGGFSTYLIGTPWSEDFMRQYAAALEGRKISPEIGAARTKPGSFNELVTRYYRSPEFLNLAPTTQRLRRGVIEKVRRHGGDALVVGLPRTFIAAVMGDYAQRPAAGNTWLKTMRVLCAYAVNIGMMESNPAIGLRRFKENPDGFHEWSEEEIAQYEARHPLGTKARLALALLLHTAQRRQDIVRMGWQHVRGNRIAVKQLKTGASLLIPISSELAQALASLPRDNLTFLLNQYGRPHRADGFGHWFREQCRAAGLPKACRSHGLRKAAARRLTDAGCTAHEIASITGHKTLKEIERYTRGADQARLADRAMDKVARAKVETEIVQPSHPAGRKRGKGP